MIIKRALAFLIDLLLSAIAGFIFLFPLADFLGKHLSKLFVGEKTPRITDLGEVYLLMILIYILITLPFALMPFRFLFEGKSLGSYLMDFHIENIKYKKTATWKQSLLRSPPLLILGCASFLHLIDYIILGELYPNGHYDLFLSIHFILLFVSIVALILLLTEWLWVLFSKEHRSFGEKWSSTRVKQD